MTVRISLTNPTAEPMEIYIPDDCTKEQIETLIYQAKRDFAKQIGIVSEVLPNPQRSEE